MGGPAWSMMMQRTPSDMVLRGVRGTTQALSCLARSAARFCPSAVIGGSLPVRRIHDQRRAQVRAMRALAPVQAKLVKS